MASTRRASTDRGHRVANGKRSADVVGVVAAGGVWGCRRSWRRWIGCWTIRGSSSRTGGSSTPVGAAVDPDRDVPAVDVPEVPLPAGFERLCGEVADSIGWQRFCRIPLGGSVPHPTTLMKITSRCGRAAVDALNEALLAKAVEAKVLRTGRLRADTTVVEANVAYPTDSGLLAKGVAKLARDRQAHPGRRAWRPAPKLGDRTRSRCGAGPRSIAREPAAPQRRPPRRGAAHQRRAGRHRRAGRPPRPTPWSATPAAACAAQAPSDRPARRKRWSTSWNAPRERVERVAAQTRQRLAGDDPGRLDPARVAA